MCYRAMRYGAMQLSFIYLFIFLFIYLLFSYLFQFALVVSVQVVSKVRACADNKIFNVDAQRRLGEVLKVRACTEFFRVAYRH